MPDRVPAPARHGAGLLERHPWLPVVLVIINALLLAGHSVVGRAIREDIPPAGLVFWRSLVAAAVLMPFIYPLLRAQLALVVRHWKLMLLLGLTQTVFGQLCLYIGLHTTTAINTGLINATLAPLTVLFAWLLLGDRISARQGVGLAIAIVGVIAVIARGDIDVLLGLDLVIGDLWVELAFASWALYTVLVKRTPASIHPMVMFQAMTVAAIVVMVPIYGAEIAFTDDRVHFNAVTVATVLYAALFTSLVALVFWNLGIIHIGPTRVGMMTNLVPVFTAVLAIALLGEVFRLYHVVGIALVFVGVYLSTRARGPRAPSTHHP